jgi:hypothetical protein
MATNTGEYIQKMDQYLAFKISLIDDFQEFRVKSNLDYTIRPNVTHLIKLSGHYRFISMAAGFAPGFIPGNHDDALKGDTRIFSLGMNLAFGHWLQGMAYDRIHGFYLANTADFNVNWVKGTDPYVQFPDLVYNGFQGYTGYKFNNRFSDLALNSQTERQLKGAGTFITLFSYRYYIMDNRIELTGQNSSQKSNNFEALLSAGYFRTFIFMKDFYFSAGIVSGGGIIFTRLLTRFPGGNEKDNYHNPIWRLEGHGALGYNSERFFAGAQLKVTGAGYEQNRTSTIIVNNRFTYQFFIGYRFGAPRFVEKITDKAEMKMDQSGYMFHRDKKSKQ